MATVVATLNFGSMIVQALNASDVLFHRGFGAYLLGLAALLATSSLMFVRLLSFVRRGDA